MKNNLRFLIPSPVYAVLTAALLAPAIPTLASPFGSYSVTNIVSDLPGAATNQDALLQNPWGFVFDPNNNLIVADNNDSQATFYLPDGTVVPFSINVPSNPSGMDYNYSLTDFLVGPPTNRQPAQLLFCTESGTILGFTLAVEFNTADVVVDDSASGAVYKGMTIARVFGRQYLYVTDFHNGVIKQYDHNFQLVRSFTDSQIPAGFAPFNIRAIGDLLYVTYAKQDSAGHDDAPGAGNGFMDIFSPGGFLVRRLVMHGALNSPWGLALAPAGFGRFSGALLVGNFGDGTINAYEPFTGYPLGHLSDSTGNPISIPGLWSIKFLPTLRTTTHSWERKGDDEDRTASLYFTSGPNSEHDGVIGIITPAEHKHHFGWADAQ